MSAEAVAIPPQIAAADEEALEQLRAVEAAQQQHSQQLLEQEHQQQRDPSAPPPQGPRVPEDQPIMDFDNAPAIETDSDMVPRAELEAMKQRHDSYMGILRSQKTRMEEMEREMSRMKSQPSPSQQAANAPQEPSAPAWRQGLSQKELESLDEDDAELQAKMMRSEAAVEYERRIADERSARTQLEQRLAQLEQKQVGSTTNAVWTRVDNIVPGAQDTNDNDPVFTEWAQATRREDGGPNWYEIGGAALGLGDAHTLAEVFKAYAAFKGDATSQRVTAQVKPATNRAASAQTPQTRQPQAPVVKQSEINAYQQQVSRGAFVGKEAEATEIENRHAAALIAKTVVIDERPLAGA